MTASTPTMSHAANARASDWLLLVVPGVIWGASFLFIAEGLEAIGPFGVAFVRILVGCSTLSLFAAARKPIPRGDWGRIALLGLTWMAFPLTLFPFAEQRVTSALTGMLNGAVPLFVALVAAGISRRPPGRGISAGLAVGLVGAVLMALPTMHQGRSSAAGVLMILMALVSYGFAVNLARGLQQRHGAMPVIWRAQLAALALTAPLGVPDLVAAHWTPAPLLSLLALGALGTGLAFVLTTIAAGRLGATRASATAYMIPPVSLLLGVLVRREHVAVLSLLGGAVCLAGAWVMRRAQSDAPSAGPRATRGGPARSEATLAAPPTPTKGGGVSAARRHPMHRMSANAIMCLPLLLRPLSPARAQQRADAGPNFLFFRYASHASAAMYSGYTVGAALMVVGLLHNPHSSYREIMVGVGKLFVASNGNSLTILSAGAYTNTGWYGELYLVPSVRAGALSVNGTVELAEPMSPSGSRGLFVSLGNLLVDLAPRFSGGLGYYGSFESGAAPANGAGPAVRQAVPHGSVTLELLKNLAGSKDEVRLTLRSSF